MVDVAFQSAIPALSPEECHQLEANLLAEGCRDPLVLWEETGILLDGHHRYTICQAHAIPFQTVTVSLPDRDAALDWIDANQLGRRNLTPDQASLLRGRRYNRLKKQGARTDLTSDQNEQKSIDTAAQLAAQHGVSRATIVRDGAFAQAVEALTPLAPELPHDITTGTAPSKTTILDAASLAPTQPDQALVILQHGPKHHRTQFTGDNEWHTPTPYLEAARAVLGTIDVDPASSDAAQETVQAIQYYTANDDGLAHPWHGRVWLNPPYAQPLIAQFLTHLLREWQAGHIAEAITLTHNYTDTAWFHATALHAAAFCFPKGRIRFVAPDGTLAAPTQGQVFLYFGPTPERFAAVFAAFGLLLQRMPHGA